jgi:CxxC motif-containing protein (DUF1111 family)
MNLLRLGKLALVAAIVILGCRFITLPGTAAAQSATALSFGSPPDGGPKSDTPSTARRGQIFQNITCQACHIITQTTSQSEYTSQSNVSFTPVSDFALHDTGIGLTDGIRHAGKTEAGRCSTRGPCDIRCHRRYPASTSDLYQAITAHASKGSKANTAISNFEMLSPADQQALLNFLRSL